MQVESASRERWMDLVVTAVHDAKTHELGCRKAVCVSISVQMVRTHNFCMQNSMNALIAVLKGRPFWVH